MLLCVRYVLCLWDADLLPLIGRLDVDFQHVLFDASYDKIDAFRSLVTILNQWYLVCGYHLLTLRVMCMPTSKLLILVITTSLLRDTVDVAIIPVG
jgi:hypothetical protein